MASARWSRSLCVTLGLLAASSEAFFQEEGGGGPAGACKFILHELVKVSERTCFDELPKFLCCHQPPSIGCFKDQAHRDLCCEGPFSQKVLAQDYLIGLVMQKQDVLQRNCPFAAALTQLMAPGQDQGQARTFVAFSCSRCCVQMGEPASAMNLDIESLATDSILTGILMFVATVTKTLLSLSTVPFLVCTRTFCPRYPAVPP